MSAPAGRRRLTYAALDARANQLAHRLGKLRIGPDRLVGVCVERGVDVVVSVLGVLKAGAAYLPLDPAYPRERLLLMAADSGVGVVVSSPGPGTKLFGGATLVDLSLDPVLATMPTAPPGVTVTGANLAYVLYTSGSTGRPKGVAVTHASASALIDWALEAYTQEELAGVLAATSLCFDLSVFEMFAPLSCGGTAIVASNVLQLPELAEYGVSLINTVPSAMAEVLSLGPLPPSARVVNLAGEALGRPLVDRLYDQPGVRRVVNLYGPSEDTTYSTVAVMSRAGSGVPLIGHPLPGTYTRLLDAHQNPVSSGEPGELFLGGAGLSRGYLHRPALTAERFLPDPSGPPGSRLYRTGDRVRQRPDSALEFLGRLDFQVKVRGFRIELGEVEAALAACTGVAQAAVVAGADGRTLVAYVVAEGGHPSALRAQLARVLPDYMLPTTFVMVDALPRTPNGKVDRATLTEIPVLPRPGPPEAQGSPEQERVAAVWADALGRDHVGPQEHFLDVGGHSLVAIQIVARLRRLFGTDLGVAELFEHPTVAALTARLLRAPGGGRRPSVDRIERVPRNGPHPLSSAQLRFWVLDQLQPDATSYSIPTSLRLVGKLDVPAMRSSLNMLIHRHEAFRTAFVVGGDGPRQVVAPARDLDLVEADFRDLSPPERESAARALHTDLVRRPFDLAEPAFLRAALVRFGEEEHLLLLVTHHIAFDDWSMNIVMEELSRLYAAFHAGTEPELPEPDVQPVDLAAWQRSPGQVSVLERETGYWERQLRGAPTSIDLRTSGSRPDLAGRSATLRMELGTGLSRDVRVLSRAHDATPYMTLLAGFGVLLGRHIHRTDLLVGTAVAGRSYVETERVIGCFVNMLVMRLNLSGAPAFSELLRRVRATALEAFAHEVPFDKLVERLRPQRHRGRNPLVQVALGVRNAPAPVDVGGIRFTREDGLSEQARLDLTVWVEVRPSGTMSVLWTYDAGIFDVHAIGAMHTDFQATLSAAVRDPSAVIALARTDRIDPPSTKGRTIGHNGTPKGTTVRFPGAQPRAIRLSPASLVRTGPLHEARTGRPDHHSAGTGAILMEATVPAVALTAWAEEHRSALDDGLLGAGAILFRGFAVRSLTDFQRFATVASRTLIQYGERSSPRTELAAGVYTSTDHPADQPIVLHSEQSYTLNWPMRIMFSCLLAATEGGRTPFADTRSILAALDPAVVARFEALGVMYVRNYNAGLGLRWQEAFQTEDRSVVEAHCRSMQIHFEWSPGNRLRTRQVRPAIRRHPTTGEKVWFNHALFFNASSLEPSLRASLLEVVATEDLPTNTYYGDGSEIDASTLDQIRNAYDQETVGFDWEVGDVLLLDNMLTAHGREPFVGERRVVAAMADPYADAAVVTTGRPS